MANALFNRGGQYWPGAQFDDMFLAIKDHAFRHSGGEWRAGMPEFRVAMGTEYNPWWEYRHYGDGVGVRWAMEHGDFVKGAERVGGELWEAVRLRDGGRLQAHLDELVASARKRPTLWERLNAGV